MRVKLRYLTLLLFWLIPAKSVLAGNPDAVAGNAASAAVTDSLPKPSNAEELKQIPVLKRQVRVGEIITAEDIMYDSRPARSTRNDIVTDANALVGKSAKHNIMQGRPIRPDEVASPAILFKGSRVTMIYRSQNLEIRTVGEALDNGAKGDVVRVRNLTSKAIIDATVVNSDMVRVSPTESSAAEAM